MGRGVLSLRGRPHAPGGTGAACGVAGEGPQRWVSSELGVSGPLACLRGWPLPSLCFLVLRSAVPVTFRMRCDITAHFSFPCNLLNKRPRLVKASQQVPPQRLGTRSAHLGSAHLGATARGSRSRPASPSATCCRENDRQVRRPEECGLVPALRQAVRGRQWFALLTRPRDVARSPS